MTHMRFGRPHLHPIGQLTYTRRSDGAPDPDGPLNESVRIKITVLHVSEEQYQSFLSVLSKTMQHSGWMVGQISFITGALSLNVGVLEKNLEYFKVPNRTHQI